MSRLYSIKCGHAYILVYKLKHLRIQIGSLELLTNAVLLMYSSSTLVPEVAGVCETL